MKTRISILTLVVAVAAAGLIFSGCNGDDLSTPTIVLEGDNPYIIPLGGTWTEPGFTATDDEDGDVTADVTFDDSQVNTNQIGEYEVTYTVTDKAGNEGVETRIVRVVMDKAHYEGTYSVHELCDMDGDGIKGEAGVPYEINDYNVTVSSGAADDELLFDNFGAYLVYVVPVFFSGDLSDALTVDNYNPAGTTIYFNADGAITTGTTSSIIFYLNYTATDGADTVPCDATFTKL